MNAKLLFVLAFIASSPFVTFKHVSAAPVLVTGGLDVDNQITVVGTVTVKGDSFSVNGTAAAITGAIGGASVNSNTKLSVLGNTLMTSSSTSGTNDILKIQANDGSDILRVRDNYVTVIAEGKNPLSRTYFLVSSYEGESTQIQLSADGGDDSGDHATIRKTAQGKLLLTNSNSELESSSHLAFDSSGKVGISTSTPAATLDVNGDATFGSGSTKATFSSTGELQLTSVGILWADGTRSTTSTSWVSAVGAATLAGNQTFTGTNAFTASAAAGATPAANTLYKQSLVGAQGRFGYNNPNTTWTGRFNFDDFGSGSSRSSQGVYTVAFTTDFAAAAAITCVGNAESGSTNDTYTVQFRSYAVGSVQVRVTDHNGNVQDSTNISVMCVGAQ